jgi:predicted ATPase
MAWMPKKREIRMPAPYLKRLWLDPSRIPDRAAYPYCLPFLADDFDLRFERAITIIVGENGTGKSTLLEGIAALAGYDEAGGGKGYRPVDHADAIEVTRAADCRNRCARAGCQRSPMAGSSAPLVFRFNFQTAKRM